MRGFGVDVGDYSDIFLCESVVDGSDIDAGVEEKQFFDGTGVVQYLE